MLFRFSFSNISQHFLEDSETIFKRLCRALGHLINSFYYNLLIKALELIKNVEICPKTRSNAAKGLH